MKTRKKETITLICFALLLLILPATSAEVMVGQPKSLYNIGDDFEITLTVIPRTPISDFLTASLVCNNKKVEIYRSPLSANQGEEKQVKIAAKLDTFLLQDTGGNCHIEASFGGETATSLKFEITGEIGIALNVQGIAFNPGETVSVNGKTEKANGKLVDGYVDVFVDNIDSKFSALVKDGVFNLTFRIPENSQAGNYELTVKAYEKDVSGKTTNQGETSAFIRVNQVVKEVAIALSDQSTSPKEELTYSIILYDQAGDRAQNDVSVKVYKPEGALFDQKIVRSDQSVAVPLIASSSPGYWKIEAKYEDLQSSKQFLVEEYKDISFTLIENTLIIENIGNVPFTDPIEVAIGGVTEIKEIKSLPVGSSMKYELKAPKGEYEIEVSKGSEKQTLGTTFLTGRAIGVSAPGEGGIVTTSLWVLASLILLMILALAAVYIYKRLMHPKTTQDKTLPQRKVDQITSSGIAQKTKQDNQNLIDKGVKQDASIISLHVKNMSSFANNEDAIKMIDTALWKAKEAGAKIYADGNYRIAILAPVLTRENENEVKAIQVARAMEKLISAHNRRSAQKIDFGIGVNSGTLIVETSQEKFRFMSLNNVIASTKRISELSQNETLISESVKNKMLGKAKVVKLADKNLWRVEKVIDRSAYADHISALTKRSQDRPSSSRFRQN